MGAIQLMLDGPRSQPNGPVSGSSRSSISGGVVVTQQQLGSTHFTPMGTPNSGLGFSQPAPAPISNGLMIALGLFGTLFLAVCAMLVYTFVIDKPAHATPAQAASITAPPPLPPPLPVTQTAVPQAPPSTSPSSSADAAPALITAPPTTSARKMTGEL
jgi:hypothetical protein